MFVTTFSIGVLCQIVIIIITTYLEILNFIIFFAKSTTLTYFHFMR